MTIKQKDLVKYEQIKEKLIETYKKNSFGSQELIETSKELDKIINNLMFKDREKNDSNS